MDRQECCCLKTKPEIKNKKKKTNWDGDHHKGARIDIGQKDEKHFREDCFYIEPNLDIFEMVV